MGSSQSSSAATATTTTTTSTSTTGQPAVKPTFVPQHNPSDGPPLMRRRLETFDEKLYRKFTKEPLVPIGFLATAYCLTSGMRSFYRRDAIRSQKMMRARVGAQFVTILIIIGYVGTSNVDWTLAPMYQQAQKRLQDEKNKNHANEEKEG